MWINHEFVGYRSHRRSVSLWRHAENWPFCAGFSFPEGPSHAGLGFLLRFHAGRLCGDLDVRRPGQHPLTLTDSSCAQALPARRQRVRALNPGGLSPVLRCRALLLSLRIGSFYININRSVSLISAGSLYSQARLAEHTPVAGLRLKSDSVSWLVDLRQVM